MSCLYILFLLFQLAALYNIPPPPQKKMPSIVHIYNQFCKVNSASIYS